MHGPACLCWANLMPFSPRPTFEGRAREHSRAARAGAVPAGINPIAALEKQRLNIKRSSCTAKWQPDITVGSWRTGRWRAVRVAQPPEPRCAFFRALVRVAAVHILSKVCGHNRDGEGFLRRWGGRRGPRGVLSAVRPPVRAVSLAAGRAQNRMPLCGRCHLPPRKMPPPAAINTQLLNKKSILQGSELHRPRP
jgi:hypothetical protein